MLVYTILSATVFIAIPGIAHAWGPCTHVEIAFSLLEKIALMAPAIRAIIAGREEWFVYGSIAADTVVGKKFAGPLHHCHSWKVAESLLKEAKTDRERAAAYGYLSHLAADIVAHNYYIPCKIIESYKARLISHTYWEMRFDMHVSQGVWDKMTLMIAGDFSPFDRLLERVLKHALFSFRTSKTIFSGILLLQKFKQLRRTFTIYAKSSRFRLDTKEVLQYRRLAFDAALEYLSNPGGARCLNGDPTGDRKIEYAKRLRREINRLRLRRRISRDKIKEIIASAKEELGVCSYSLQKR